MTNLRREAWSPFLKCLLDLDTWLTWSRTGQGEGRGADREPHSCSLLAPGEGVWMAAPGLIAEAPREVHSSIRGVRESRGLLSSHFRANETSSMLVSRT